MLVNKETHQPIYDLLNTMIATQAVYIFKLYQRHFYVKGSQFFTLHKKFEELYEEATEAFDETAERLLAIGGHPYSSMQEFLEHSILEEHPFDGNSDAKKMVEDTVADMKAIRAGIQEGIELTGEKGDDTTQDMLIDFGLAFDKHIWMFQAFLDREATE